MEKEINEKIVEIVKQANDMIPVEWDDLYIRAEVDKTYSGGIYFFYKYQGIYHYSLDIPGDFNLSMDSFLELNRELFYKAQDLKKVFLENDLADWSSCIIHLDENNKLSVEFDYAPWLETKYGPSARTSFFEYKYLGREPRDEKEAQRFQAMEAFQREYNG